MSIPRYDKEYRDNFTYHYWRVEYDKYDEPHWSFVSRKSYLYKERKLDEFFADIRGYDREKIENEFQLILKQIIEIDYELSKAVSKEIGGYRHWKDGDQREITVAEFKEDNRVKWLAPSWGLAIFKPNDTIEVPDGTGVVSYSTEEPVHFLKPSRRNIGWVKEVPQTEIKLLYKTKKINFTKKLGQVWSIRDFERKHGRLDEDA